VVEAGGDPDVLTLALYNPARRAGLVWAMNWTGPVNLRMLNLLRMAERLSKEAGVIPVS
jgi:hypothetical protein